MTSGPLTLTRGRTGRTGLVCGVADKTKGCPELVLRTPARGVIPTWIQQEETVEKHSGRHRRRRQGWGEQVRWVLGVVLAALFCGPTGPSTRLAAEVRPPLPSRRVRGDREPVSVRAAVKERADVPRPRPGEEQPREAPVRVPPQRTPYTGPRGWCEDDEGVRGVRPYLARHEDRVVRAHNRGEVQGNRGRETAGGRGPATSPHSGSGGGGKGEFAELAHLVRRWQAITT